MRMFTTRVRVCVGLGLALGTLSCSVETADETLGTTAEEVTRYPAGLASGIQYGFSWSYQAFGYGRYLFPGLPAPNTVACGITAVGGHFTSAGDWMRVGTATDGWVAYGDSGGGDPAMDAMCFSLPAGAKLGPYEVWDGTAGTPPATTMHVAGGAIAGNSATCFLTGIQGVFTGYYLFNAVRLRIVNGQWKLDGQPGRKAWANCVNVAPVNPEGQWTYPNNTSPLLMANGDTASSPHFCGLTRIHGSINGGWTGTYVKRDNNTPSGWSLYLSGGANPGSNEPIGSSSRCLW
jgi:hypothetical protein